MLSSFMLIWSAWDYYPLGYLPSHMESLLLSKRTSWALDTRSEKALPLGSWQRRLELPLDVCCFMEEHNPM